ncbi:MAG: hypothetical protein AB7U82_35835, partial [Blastocatellales bacterium]
RSADAGMSFGKVKDKMTTDRSKPENAGSLELSRVAWPGIPGSLDGSIFHTYKLVVRNDTQATLFVDGVQVVQGVLIRPNTLSLEAVFGDLSTSGGNVTAEIEFIRIAPLNQMPVAMCQNLIISAGADCTANASINNGSFDPDGDALTIAQSPPGPYPLGDTLVTLTVTDSKGASSQCVATVTVVDNTAPAITGVSANPSTLWPPNHKMVDVTVNYNLTDNCAASSAITCALSVTSNEPVNGGGDGNTAPDWEVVDAHHVRLRAERSGGGGGRIYTITITCTDDSGNPSIRTVTVRVPKSQS